MKRKNNPPRQDHSTSRYIHGVADPIVSVGVNRDAEPRDLNAVSTPPHSHAEALDEDSRSKTVARRRSPVPAADIGQVSEVRQMIPLLLTCANNCSAIFTTLVSIVSSDIHTSPRHRTQRTLLAYQAPGDSTHRGLASLSFPTLPPTLPPLAIQFRIWLSAQWSSLLITT